MTESIKEMVQRRITNAWGWLPNEPEAVTLAENVEFVANLLVVGTRTKPETLIDALVNGPEWGQAKLLEEWNEAEKRNVHGYHDGAGFADRNWARIKGILELISR